MKDRARALLNLVEADRNRLYGAHRIFLRQLCKVFPDIEAEQRAKVTVAARELLGKKGAMVHQVFMPQEPSVEQDLKVSAEEGIDAPTNYKACLKGIAKRLIYHQSNPSNGNVSMLIGHSTTTALLDATLRVIAAQRWHLRAGHEPLSLQLLTTAIKRWPVDDSKYAENLADFLEKAVSRESNHACLLTPKVLIAAVEAVSHRLVNGPHDAETTWNWLSIALRLCSTARAYCGEFIEQEEQILAAYVTLFSQAARHNVGDCMIPGSEQKLSELLLQLIEATLSESSTPLVSDFALADAMRIFVQAKKELPASVKDRIATPTSLLHLYSAYYDSSVDPVQLESIQLPETVPQSHASELRAFLSGSVQTA